MEAFPLSWPTGYKRTTVRVDSRFKSTPDRAQHFLMNELSRLGAKSVILSTNVPLRKDGGIYSDYMLKKIDDPGVAVYFKYQGKDITMCCDQYQYVWENVLALGKGIEALRGMERWGVSEFLERAFTGFKALPESTNSKKWFEVLGVPPTATSEQVKEAFRQKAKNVHPDTGGSDREFLELQLAYQEGLKAVAS